MKESSFNISGNCYGKTVIYNCLFNKHIVLQYDNTDTTEMFLQNGFYLYNNIDEKKVAKFLYLDALYSKPSILILINEVISTLQIMQLKNAYKKWQEQFSIIVDIKDFWQIEQFFRHLIPINKILIKNNNKNIFLCCLYDKNTVFYNIIPLYLLKKQFSFYFRNNSFLINEFAPLRDSIFTAKSYTLGQLLTFYTNKYSVYDVKDNYITCLGNPEQNFEKFWNKIKNGIKNAKA